MAVIGSWGNVVFSVSRTQIKTFDGLKWDSGARYSTHERHLKDPLLEFTGTDIETITFSMFFSEFLGVSPIQEIEKLLAAMKAGEVHRLIIGLRAYGTDKWVITKMTNSLERYDKSGNLIAAKVDITMKSYASR